MTWPNTDSNRVYISNREIYDMVVAMEKRINALNNKLAGSLAFNGVLSAVLTYLIIEGLKP